VAQIMDAIGAEKLEWEYEYNEDEAEVSLSE
jgi:hypothetical protein